MVLRELKKKPNLGVRGRAIFGLVMGSLILVLMLVVWIDTGFGESKAGP